MDRFDPFVKYADVYGDVINWEKDPMNKPQNQNKYFFSDGKTYYEQICKMLRLMSVFKQAFNQIYDNEDEIHSAWENFVDNLSATAVYGEEVGVNLTWTDTSVNFAFTIPGGQDGEDGVGIQSITFNSDYTMTITLTDGSTYTSESLRGAQGEQGIQGLQGPAGPQGEPGSGLEILDVYATLQDLQTAHPTGSPGDAYQVGTAPSFTLYIWSASQSAWVSAGTIGSAVPSSALPLMDGTASAGISDLYARGDHVHPTDTSRASAQDLQTVDDKVDAVDEKVDDISDIINTSQKLIDQSFVYRESPAEHDGLAVLDTIKGHTVKFNQLVPINTQTSTTINGVTFTNNNDGSITVNGTASTNAGFSGGNWNPASDFSKDLKTRGGHKILVIPNSKNYSDYDVSLRAQGFITDGTSVPVNEPTIFQLASNISTFATVQIYPLVLSEKTANNFYCKPNIFDLTDIFGAGNEPATPEAFENWLSQNLGLLDYYAYTPGTLIPFKGAGLKTTGINLLNEDNARLMSNNPARVLIHMVNTINQKTAYTLKWNNPDYLLALTLRNLDTLPSSLDDNSPSTVYDSSWTNSPFVTPVFNVIGYFSLVARRTDNLPITNNDLENIKNMDIMLYKGTEEKSFEPYTESTLSLEALNTLFPTGMKLAGSVYDEATSNRADTRIGSVDLGSLDYSTYNGMFYHRFDVGTISIITDSNQIANISCGRYEAVSYNSIDGGAKDKSISSFRSANMPTIFIRDSSYVDVATFKQAMSGVMLYYELATPTEQDIDLDLSFKAYEGGTEQLLPVNGSTPTTSSLLADMTYFSINDAMDYILAKLDQDVSSITSDITSLKTRMTSAEGNITSLGGRMTTAEGNITSLTGRMTTAEGNISSNASRISELETDLLKIVVKEIDFETASAEGNFGTTRQITVDEGYTALGVVGTEIQNGEYTSPSTQLAITQCHVYYSSNDNLMLSLYARNNFVNPYTDIRIYVYLLCIKDIQSE